jgi:spore coat-associated protein N
MSRRKALRANPRRLLAALATILVAVGVTVASGATFTAQTANANNVFTAGTMSMTNDVSGAILTASNMKPGDPATKGVVTIKNTGSLAGAFTLTRSSLSDTPSATPLSSQLNLLVTDCGADLDCTLAADNTVRYNGALSAMTTAISLGAPWASNASHKFEFAASLPSTTPNAYQGASTTAGFTWDVA